MATTTNYSWTTPDDTGLVKDGAAAIRTLGSSIDTTTKNLNPETTLGDIAYRSSTANVKTRLGIGSTGNVLTVSGGVPVWAAPSAATQTFTAINAGGTTLTGASTITISGLSGYNQILMFYKNASSGAADAFSVRLNADSGANYNNARMWLGWGASNAVTGNGGVQDGATSFGGGQTSGAAGVAHGSYHIFGANSTGIKPVIGWGTGLATGGEFWSTNGYYAGTSVISSISLISSTNFDGGTIYVFGA